MSGTNDFDQPNKMDGSSERIDGNDFLRSLRSSIPENHYKGTGATTAPQTEGERLASSSNSSRGMTEVREKPPPHPKTNKKQVSLQDVLQAEPVESQVDTALMQSFDEQRGSNHHSPDQPHHRPVATGTSTILSNVPLDEYGAVHDFEVSPLPPMNQDDDYVDGMEGSGRPLSEHSGQARPLLQRSGTASQSKRIFNLHKRGLSVEQTLVDLTLAMKELHGKTPKLHRRLGTASSTADEFAQNALRLHDQQQQDSEHSNPSTTSTSTASGSNTPSSPSSPSGTGRRLWDTLLEGLPTLREQADRDNAAAVSSNSTGSSDTNRDENAASSGMGTTADVELGQKHSSTKSANSSSSIPQSQNGKTKQGNKKKRPSKDGHKKLMHKNSAGPDAHQSGTMDKFKQDWQAWTEFFRPRREHIFTYIKSLTCYLVLPMVGIAAILFYFADNPTTGKTGEDEVATKTSKASASYILLFCCRQVVTFSLSFATQLFVIDFLALNTRILLNLIGPVVTLLVVQSKGWPFLLLFWSIYDFVLLAGDHPYVHHWLYFQSTIGVFSEKNPSGQIVDNKWYWRALTIAISVSLAVSVKRFLVGLYLGRATFSHYGKSLAKSMAKMLLVGELAAFAKDIEEVAMQRGEGVTERLIAENAAIHGLSFTVSNEDEENTTVVSKSHNLGSSMRSIDPSQRDPLTGTLQYSERLRIMQLLEQWEEPVRNDDRSRNECASISAVLRFQKALTFIQRRYPFGKEFGLADSREACIASAQEVYRRLMMATPGEEVLSFETMAFLALEDGGTVDEDKVKALIKIFRPNRSGQLSLLDFCKSVDAVYKEFRFLGATIENSSKIDRAFENIFNAVFYIIMGCIILSQLGFDPLSLFLSLSSVILAFAFMIGSASAKYFEGILFILVRRPYGIGDRIQVGNIESDGSLHGALPWSVENVTLFETTLVYLPTNERASLSNGSLANSRIINWARSPQAQFHIFLQFPLNTPYQKLVLFKKAVEEYMRARPREWRALNGFRCNMVYAKENYMEYIIIIQHREAWQEVGQVLDSKANLTSYCQEVARQLDMEYQAPQVPVHLTHEVSGADRDLVGPSATTTQRRRPATAVDDEQLDENELTHKFADIAHHKHSIRVC